MLSYRNGICKSELSTYILFVVKVINACGFYSQHPCKRMPEKLFLILAPSTDQIRDQIYTPDLLWSEISTLSLRKEQT